MLRIVTLRSSLLNLHVMIQSLDIAKWRRGGEAEAYPDIADRGELTCISKSGAEALSWALLGMEHRCI